MGSIQILVVDDESIVAKDIQYSLIKMGYFVTATVSSGEAALEEIGKVRPDIIIMDVKLNGKMDGIETANAIKEKHNIPVIFLSGFADESTLNKAKRAEPYSFLVKPFRDKDLQAAVEVAVYKHDHDFLVKRDRDLLLSISKKDTGDSIFIHADYRISKIKYADLYFVEALKDYVVMHTANNTYTTHITMKHLNTLLPSSEFIRVHRSYIVRLDKIFSIKHPNLVIEGKTKVIPIGGYFKKELYNRLNMV